MRCALPHVKEVLPRDHRGGVLVDCKPNLGPVCGVQVIGRPRASHLGRHPAGFQRVGENTRPAGCDGESQQHVVQFGIGISLLSSPRAVFPGQILQAWAHPVVQSELKIDEALRLLDKRRENIGGEGVDREYLRERRLRWQCAAARDSRRRRCE